MITSDVEQSGEESGEDGIRVDAELGEVSAKIFTILSLIAILFDRGIQTEPVLGKFGGRTACRMASSDAVGELSICVAVMSYAYVLV